MWIFEIQDKSGRLIHLSNERWKHICNEHPEISLIGLLQDTLTKPLIITKSEVEETVHNYYLQLFENKEYLLVMVKYLNGKGFIITAYKTRKIK